LNACATIRQASKRSRPCSRRRVRQSVRRKDLSLAHDYFSEAVRQSPVYFAEAERNLARVRSERGK
jgi:hypothetical protein